MDYNVIVMSGMVFLIVCLLLGAVPALFFYLRKKNVNI
ncbi:hypothetical protein SAMN04489735_10524 [Aneurinibacillus thermoaerophilus]|uniref:Uncharacterized protein n=1 Tax=Aneurinibacillus thermoaerophilus TaxID=143495 RepID=A0A1G8EZM2_ANETH|nr:hypothetical protein SAMN04489735_10524 [Aneurinibacillus thermoaerophilus]